MGIVSDILLRSRVDKKGFDDAKREVSSLKREFGIAFDTFQRQSEKSFAGFNRSIIGIRSGLISTTGGFILGNLINDATSALIDFGKSFIQVGSDVQQFKLSFTNIFRVVGLSIEEAGIQAERYFAFAKEVAKTTPFDLPEITQGIIRLQTFGVSVEKVLPRAIDLASGLHANLEFVVEAFNNLQSGRFGIAFREFAQLGIARDLLEGKGLVFDRGGEYQGSAKQAMSAVLEIIDEHFQGFAASQQGTFAQLKSNLNDIIFQLKEAIGTPVFRGINADFKDFVDTLSENQPAVEAYATAIGELFEGVRSQISGSIKGIVDDATAGTGTGIEDFFNFGVNLFQAFAEGILQGGQFVLEATVTVAQGIAFFLESFSPPKGGPLHEIDLWGANLMNTYLEGMGEADFGILSDLLSQVRNQFEALVGAGLIDTETPKQDFIDLANTILEGFDDIIAGGDDATAVFERLSEVIGGVAFDIQAMTQATLDFNAAAAEVDRIEETLSDLSDSSNRQEQDLRDDLEDLRREDQIRRDAFDAAQDAAAEADSGASDLIDAQNDAADAARKNAKKALDTQIELLQDQKEEIENTADIAVEAIEEETKAAISLLEQQGNSLDVIATTAQRALEDFNFQTEGIPERFTRQRRRELEAIATQRKREAEDGKRAIDDEKDRIKRNSDLRIDGIRKAAKAEKDALDAQIEGYRDQADALDDQFKRIERNNNERKKREKFVPDPRIKELEDEYRIIQRNNEEKKRGLEDELKEARKVAEERRKALDELEAQFKAQLDIIKILEAAQEEAERKAKEALLDEDRNDAERVLEPLDEEVTNFNEKLDEARKKLLNLITEEDRARIKKDLQFFADFAQGLLGIEKEDGSTPEGFLQGKALAEAAKRIKTAFTEDVIPVVIAVKDGFFAAAAFADQVLEGINKIKGGAAEVLKFLSLDDIPVFKQITDFLERPFQKDLATLGGLYLFFKLTPGLSFKMLFSISYKLIGVLAGPLLNFLLGFLGLTSGAGGAGAAASAGGSAGAGLAALATSPITITVAIVLAVALAGFILATDFKGLRTKLLDFMKKNPEIGAILQTTPFLNIPFNLAVAFDSISNIGELPGKVKEFFDSLTGLFSGLSAPSLPGLPDFFDNVIDFAKNISGVGDGAGSALNGIAGGIGDLAKSIGRGFANDFRDAYNAFKPWLELFKNFIGLNVSIASLPGKIVTDFMEQTFIPLFKFAAPEAIKIFNDALSGLGSIGLGIVQEFGRQFGLVFTNIIFPLLSAGGGLAGIFGEALKAIGPIFSDVFKTLVGMAREFGVEFGGAIAGLVTGLSERVGPSIAEFAGKIANVFGAVITPAIDANKIAVDGLKTAYDNLKSFIGPASEAIGGFFEGTFKVGYDFIKNQVIPFLSTTLPETLNSVVEKADAFVNSDWLTRPFSTFATFADTTLKDLITDRLPGYISTFVTKIGGSVGTLATQLSTHATTVVTTIGRIPGNITSAFGSGLNLLHNFGANVVRGIINGFISQYQAFVGAINKYIIDPLKTIPGVKLVTNSPSKWMEDHIGKNVILGIVNGLQRNEELKNAMNNVSDIMKNVDMAGLDYDAMGRISADKFVSSFKSSLAMALTRDATLQSLLDVRINNIAVNVDGKKQNITAPTGAAAASVVTKILKDAS